MVQNSKSMKMLPSLLCSQKAFNLRELLLVNCQGPAPVDPGNSKGGRRWRGKTCLFINVRLD